MPVRRSLPLRTSDQVRRRNFGPGGLPARRILLMKVGVLPYAAGPSGILELGYIPARLSLDDFGGFVCDSKRNLSKSTAAVDGVAEPLACDLALNSKEVL